MGRFREGFMCVEDRLYGFLECNDKVELPEGFREIKGSEYYKIREDAEGML